MRTALLFLLILVSLPAQRLPWDIASLARPPMVFNAETTEPGVKAVFYESVPWRGKPTRVFAYIGMPEGSQRVPAMVLIHGGGGTAFAEWVRMWNKRGYAAIAMDTCGNQPETAAKDKLWNPARKHHEFGGPEGWGGFGQIDEPERDQWSYHAVAAAVLAHSLLRADPRVDVKRIGVTGISWGGYLTNIVSSVDKRFRFAAPVYGCGFLGEDSAWLKQFADMGPDRAKKWLTLWDPSSYLPLNRHPMLWVTGTNDFAYVFSSLQKSYRLPKGPRTLAIRVRMPHNHPDGAKPEEIVAFAADPKTALPRFTSVRTVAGTLTASYRTVRPVTKAELNFTRDGGRWQDRKWESVPASLDVAKKRVTAKIPDGARVWYLNVFDDRGLVSSTEHESR